MIIHVVPSRDALLEHVIARAVSRRQAEILDHLADESGRDALRSLVEWVVLGPGEDTHRFWLALVMGAADEPVVRRQLDDFNDWWDELVASHAARVDGPLDPEELADAIDVITVGLIVAGVETREVWAPRRRRSVLDVLLVPLGL